MDVHSIKQHIIDNPESIEGILETSGFQRIRSVSRDEYRCAFDYDSNPTSVRVDKNTLASSDFGRGIKGDIITLVSYKTGLDFRQTLELICDAIGLDINRMTPRAEIKLPFGGFFKKIGSNNEDNKELKVLDEGVLDNFVLMPSKMFYDDGIPVKQQAKYNIGYDVLTGRVIMPHWNTRGDIIGIMGRKNNEIVDEDSLKYFPIYPHPKSMSLYGYHHNYYSILESGIAVVCESEKSVMKLDAMGLETGLALGGNSISNTQARNIQATMPKAVILGLDEGLDEEYVIEEANKLKLENPFININVGYIWDGENEVMTKGAKQAPMDKTKKEFEYLMRNCVKWL